MQIMAHVIDSADVYTFNSERKNIFVDVQHKFNSTAVADEFPFSDFLHT